MSRTFRPRDPVPRRMATSSAVVNAGGPTLHSRSRGGPRVRDRRGTAVDRSIAQHCCPFAARNENRISASAPKYGYRRAQLPRAASARAIGSRFATAARTLSRCGRSEGSGVGAEGQIVAPGSNSTGGVTHSGGQPAFLAQIRGEIRSIGIRPAANRPQRAPWIALGSHSPASARWRLTAQWYAWPRVTIESRRSISRRRSGRRSSSARQASSVAEQVA